MDYCKGGPIGFASYWQPILTGLDNQRSNLIPIMSCLANTRANDSVAESISKCMEENSTIEKLNVESNFISAKPMQELVHQSCQSKTLTELRIDNQRNK